MAGNPQQQQWRGPDFSITSFEVPEAVKPDEEFTAVVVVSYRRREPPRVSQAVIFEVDGMEIGEVLTDAEGRAPIEHSLDEIKSHRITAQIRGIPPSRVLRRVAVKTDAPEPKIAKSLKVSIVGSRGDQQLVISIAGEDGMFIPKFPFVVVDNGRVYPNETDEDGTAIYRPHITEASRPLEVRAGNTTELIWKGRLLGPRLPHQLALFAQP